MFNDIYQSINLDLTVTDILINFGIAFLCGLIIAFTYKKTYKGPGYLNSFVNSIIILSMITALVIMIIGNNLARAFGLVGAMSIIRFRTAVKDTQDIIFIFFSLAAGMAAGVGMHELAISSSILISIVFFILNKTGFIDENKKQYLLQITCNTSDSTDIIESQLKKYCKKYKLINIKTLNENSIEMYYNINIKDKTVGTLITENLQNESFIDKVNIFFDEEYF